MDGSEARSVPISLMHYFIRGYLVTCITAGAQSWQHRFMYSVLLVRGQFV